MGYGNQGYGQQRGGYGQQAPKREVMRKGVLDHVEERQGKSGKTYYVAGIAGTEYSFFDSVIADELEQTVGVGNPVAIFATQNGKYWNLERIADPNEAAAAPSSPPMGARQAAPTNNGNAREDYWQRKFEFETTVGHLAIVNMNAVGNARQIVKDLKDLGLLNLDKYAGKKSPQDMYLAAIYDLADDIAAHVKDDGSNETQAPKQVSERIHPPAQRGPGAVNDEDFQPGA